MSGMPPIKLAKVPSEPSLKLVAPASKDAFAARGPSLEAKTARTSQESFLNVMSQHITAGDASKPFGSLNEAQKAERARNAAEELVSVAFVQPILKNLRGGGVMGELPAPFGPGAGEKQFRTIADAQMAQHLVHASRWGLVDSLTKKLLKPRAASKHQMTKQEIATADALPGSPAALKRYKLAKAEAAAEKAPASLGSTIDTVH